MTGALAALAACGIGRGGAFTFVTDFDLAAGRTFDLALFNVGRALELAATFFLALPLALVGTDRFLFI
jgi:hypothetical protein